MAGRASEESIPKMSVEEFCEYLSVKFEEDVIESLRKNKISGKSFMKLSEQQLERLVVAIGDVVELQALQTRVKRKLNPLAEQVCFDRVSQYINGLYWVMFYSEDCKQ